MSLPGQWSQLEALAHCRTQRLVTGGATQLRAIAATRPDPIRPFDPPETLVTVGHSGGLWSSDGRTGLTTQRTAAAGYAGNFVGAGWAREGGFYAFGANGVLQTSADGVSWASGAAIPTSSTVTGAAVYDQSPPNVTAVALGSFAAGGGTTAYVYESGAWSPMSTSGTTAPMDFVTVDDVGQFLGANNVGLWRWQTGTTKQWTQVVASTPTKHSMFFDPLTRETYCLVGNVGQPLNVLVVAAGSSTATVTANGNVTVIAVSSYSAVMFGTQWNGRAMYYSLGVTSNSLLQYDVADAAVATMKAHRSDARMRIPAILGDSRIVALYRGGRQLFGITAGPEYRMYRLMRPLVY